MAPIGGTGAPAGWSTGFPDRVSNWVAAAITRPLFATSREQAKRFPHVVAEIRQLEQTRRAAALYRSHPAAEPSETFVTWLRKVIVERTDNVQT